MNDVQRLLARQAEWQKSRQALSWPEKIRMVEAIRESVLKLAASRQAPPTAPPAPATDRPTPRPASRDTSSD